MNAAYLDSPAFLTRQAIAAGALASADCRRILDVGCGSHPIIRFLQHSPDNIVTVDPAIKSDSYVAGGVLVKQVCALVENLRPPYGFDALVCLGLDGRAPVDVLVKIAGHAKLTLLEASIDHGPSARQLEAIISQSGLPIIWRLRTDYAGRGVSEDGRFLRRVFVALGQRQGTANGRE